MYLEWNETYSVGIKTFDDEHKILFGLINNLHTGIKEKRNHQAIGETLSGLVTYVKLHFKSEEETMLKYAYPDYQTHKEEHDAFAARANVLYERFQKDEAVLSAEVLRFLVDWLHKHLNGTDKLYTKFLTDKGVK